MGLGLEGWLSAGLFGDPSGRNIEDPSMQMFGPNTVGGGWQDYLKKLYATDTTDTPQYKTQSTALRDALTRQSAGQQEQFSLASNAGGFYDSGARLSGLGEINRSQMENYSQGLTQILGRLEEQKMQAAFPFLQSKIGLWGTIQGARSDAANTQQQYQASTKAATASVFGSMMGGGGGM